MKELNEIPTSWTKHIHFAKWIVEEKKPKVIVDLGVDYGYSTFCFALPGIGKVYGIDSFEGEEQTGERNTFDYVNEKKKQLNLNNITFIEGKFDDVAKDWNIPIDILHIDGHHSYESVKNDYMTWAKFVKDDGIILLHDTCVKEPGFGVHRFFDDISLPKTNFPFCSGLGVISKNSDIINKINSVFKIKMNDNIFTEFELSLMVYYAFNEALGKESKIIGQYIQTLCLRWDKFPATVRQGMMQSLQHQIKLHSESLKEKKDLNAHTNLGGTVEADSWIRLYKFMLRKEKEYLSAKDN